MMHLQEMLSSQWLTRARPGKVPRRAEKLYHALNADERRDVRWLLMDMSYAFSVYGASAQSVEYNLMLVSIYYGLKGYYRYEIIKSLVDYE
jgi:hypothetical protein